MAVPISQINLTKLISFDHNNQQLQNRSVRVLGQPKVDSSFTQYHVADNPTELILKSAMEKINAMFAPYIGDETLKHSIESGQDMSPNATAERILSFATQLIGRAEAGQTELPSEEQRSREQLFQNIQTGIENGFTQARGILEGMQALNGKTSETVDSTYDLVQQGLAKLAASLGLTPV